MRSTSLPSVGNFRSNIQRFLDGNTPNHQTEALADFVINLKALAPLLATVDTAVASNPAVRDLQTTCKEVTRKGLMEGDRLNVVIATIGKVVEEQINQISETQEFREVIVQLILVAETLADIQVKKSVLELSRKL